MTTDQMHHGHPLVSEFRRIIVQLVTIMHDGGMQTNEISDRLRVEYGLVEEIVEYYRSNQKED